MKKIINGKRYDTETARLVGEWSNDLYINDFHYCTEALYCKRPGNYFLYGQGGGLSKYRETVGHNQWTSGADIHLLSEDEAREWAEKHLDAEAYEAEFPVMEDTDDASLMHLVGANLQRIREANGLYQVDLAEKIGSTQSIISRYERGEIEPTATRIIQLAKALGVEAGELLKV